ncbi:protein-S-isoprenylcysteine carboxyl O-methyltransferase [Sporobolomyces salmoneus]|uniref:protein-S-isoprenylcysteine carboxyl O-methyltransferase n=1 Tax=Sporobolomyces salmoneus TaxID=183962 RepID=UPI0031721C15
MTATSSDSTIPPPESPFPPRPAPTESSTSEPTTSSSNGGPVSAKPIPVEFPLTSFSSTPHNVACIGFLLGAVWSLGLTLFLANALSFSSSNPGWFVWGSKQVELSSPQSWSTSLKSPQLGFYLASWAFFHLMEFVVTSMYNPGKLSVSSYLLDNGKEYTAAHIAGVLEYVLEETFLPARFRLCKHFGGVTLIGFALVLTGQTLRSFAMISASSNFSHLISYSKLPSHQLVTSGIYSWSRHPSYAGFYWWAIGTQVALGNPICVLVFMATLQWFFSIRIRVEEKYLVKFFGQAYEDYRKKVPSRIMFVR